MPDTRLTWFNIREHIRKFGWVYVVVIAAVLAAGSLLWTSTAPSIPEDERVLIYLANPWSNAMTLDDIAEDALEKTRVYDDTLREVAFEGLMFSDPEKDYTGVMLLMTRLAVGEGDAFFAGQDAMDALVRSGACLPLDDYWASGWLGDSGLEPYYATLTDEETGETTTLMAGLKLDSLTALAKREAFDNSGAYLAVMANGTNRDTTMKALEYIIGNLRKESAQ